MGQQGQTRRVVKVRLDVEGSYAPPLPYRVIRPVFHPEDASHFQPHKDDFNQSLDRSLSETWQPVNQSVCQTVDQCSVNGLSSHVYIVPLQRGPTSVPPLSCVVNLRMIWSTPVFHLQDASHFQPHKDDFNLPVGSIDPNYTLLIPIAPVGWRRWLMMMMMMTVLCEIVGYRSL